MEVRNIEIPIVDKSQVESRYAYRFLSGFSILSFL